MQKGKWIEGENRERASERATKRKKQTKKNMRKNVIHIVGYYGHLRKIYWLNLYQLE